MSSVDFFLFGVGGFFLEYHQNVKQFGSRLFGSDLSPDCLQMLSAVDTKRQRVKGGFSSSIFSPGAHIVQWSKTVCAISVNGKYFCDFSFKLTKGQWSKANLMALLRASTRLKVYNRLE